MHGAPGSAAAADALRRQLLPASDGARRGLLPALARLVRAPLLLAGGLFVLQVCCSLATPVIIHELLTWVESGAPDAGTGAGLVVALAAACVGGFVCEWAVECVARERAGATCRAAAAALVYEKVLRASAVDAQRTHSGEATTLFSADAAALTDLPHGAIVLALQPLEIGGLVALLALYVDLAALGGLAVVLTAVLLLHVAGRRLEGLLAARSAVKDGRVRDTLEMLAGMRAVKLAALEPKFVAAIRAGRRAESALAASARWAYGVVNTTSSNGVDVISVAVVLVWTLGLRQPLTPAITFTFWVILSLLHGRIFAYPVAFQKVRAGTGAAGRLAAFLSRPERTDTRRLLPLPALARSGSEAGGEAAAAAAAAAVSAQQATCAVRVRRGAFTWALLDRGDSAGDTAIAPSTSPAAAGDPDAATTVPESASSRPPVQGAAGCLLQGVHLTLRAGELGVLVGAVGSGKSSLLHALLGEMQPVEAGGGSDGAGAAVVSSSVELATGDGPVGFVPQHAFVIGGTVRDNIVFGRRWDAARYAAVLDACALAPDMASWPRGDLSRVGAFTLSGGQKQRLSIARCVYGDSTVYLLDDCLSALDARVGRHVLERCVMGPLLGGAARLLVTSSGAALRHADWLGVLVPLTWVRQHVDAGDAHMSPALSSLMAAQPDLLSRCSRSLSGGEGPVELATAACQPPPPGTAAAAAASEAVAQSGRSKGAPRLFSSDCSASASSSSRGGESGPFTLLWGPAAAMRSDPLVAPLLAQLVGRSGSVDDAASSAPQGVPGGDEDPAAADSHDQAVDAPAPRVVTPAAAASLPTAAAAAPPTRQAYPAMPFLRSWLMGAGGPAFAGVAMLLLAIEATAVEVGVYVLAWWCEDPLFKRFSFNQYLWLYCLLVAVELAAAYARQHVYVVGITRACDELHDGLLLRLGAAPQAFFDTRSVGSLIDLVGRQLGHLDSATLYASEYFWLGCTYGLLIVLVEITITPWVLLPGALCVGLLWLVIHETAEPEGGGGMEDEELEEAGEELAQTTGKGGLCVSAADDKAAPPRSTPIPRRGTPSLSSLLAAEGVASVVCLEHFTQSLEGLPSLRALHAQGRALARHHALADGHAAAWAAAAGAQARQVLLGNLCGALFYVLSVALVVPLRLAAAGAPGGGGGISGGDAGFIVVNSAFASYMCTMVLQQRAALADLALTRGALVGALVEMPREEGATGGSAAEEAELAAVDARFRRHYDAMMRAARGDDRGACGGSALDGRAHMGPCSPRPHPPGGGATAPAAATAKQLAVWAPSAVDAAEAGHAGVAATARVSPPPPGWPARGHVVFDQLCLRYAPTLPLVLRGVCLTVPAGSTVTVIGRTGAGKSSLVAALTRLVEPTSGRITIDGVDVATLPLRALRGGVVVVSQDALFFTGSLRRNLDPFNEHPDEQLLDALRQVRLLEFAAASAAAAAAAATAAAAPSGAPTAPPPPPPSPLDMPIAERGGNLSAGQQQLLALVRALLRRPRLLVLDEATASLDAASEEALAATVATAFPAATVIQVAHRLAACARADTVVVMEAGAVGEAGPPAALLAGTAGRGLFAALVAALPPGARERLTAAVRARAGGGE